MTAVVVDEIKGKGYRLPVKEDNEAVKEASRHVDTVFKEIPFGLPTEPTPKGGGSGAGRAFSVQNYGMDQWYKLFSPSQYKSGSRCYESTRIFRRVGRSFE